MSIVVPCYYPQYFGWWLFGGRAFEFVEVFIFFVSFWLVIVAGATFIHLVFGFPLFRVFANFDFGFPFGQHKFVDLVQVLLERERRKKR